MYLIFLYLLPIKARENVKEFVDEVQVQDDGSGLQNHSLKVDVNFS
jgi:hypothetical protein